MPNRPLESCQQLLLHVNKVAGSIICQVNSSLFLAAASISASSGTSRCTGPCHPCRSFPYHASSVAFFAALRAQSSPPTTLKRMSPAPQQPHPCTDNCPSRPKRRASRQIEGRGLRLESGNALCASDSIYARIRRYSLISSECVLLYARITFGSGGH